MAGKPIGTMDGVTTPTHAARGRGARERILRAATQLFYRQGINSTGVDELARAAHVSKRTLYQHFASKDDLVAAYVRSMSEAGPTAPAGVLEPAQAPARERLLAIFDIMGQDRAPTGCPFLKASAEIADPRHPARVISARSKQDFVDALIRLAAEAGADDPKALGHQIALLFDAAQAQGVALHSAEPVGYARSLARDLIDRALG
jgi:AcrR family transcriptional regulator